jgi:hypothetical protein
MSEDDKRARKPSSNPKRLVGPSGRTRKEQREYMRKYRSKQITQMLEAQGAKVSAWVTKDEMLNMLSNRLRDGQGSTHDFRVMAELYSSMQGWAYPTLNDQARKMLMWIKEKHEEKEENKAYITKRMKVQDASLDPFDEVRALEEEE